MSALSDGERIAARMKSYTGSAVLVFFLYWLLWIPGLIVNYMYYNEAKRMEKTAERSLPGVGCLTVMLWANAVLTGVGVVAIFALLALLAIGSTLRGNTQPLSALAPDFTLRTFDGQSVTLSEFRGKVVVISFWASWLVPSRDQAPFLENTWRTYKNRGVVFLGVDVQDSESDARAFLEQFDVTYPNGPDVGSEMFSRYRISGVPATCIIDKKGNVAFQYVGPITPDSGSTIQGQFIAKLEELLA